MVIRVERRRPVRKGLLPVTSSRHPNGTHPRAERAAGPALVCAGPAWQRPVNGRGGYFFALPPPLSSLDSTAMKASCGTSTEPTIFIRFLPSFCFSSSFRLREMSPP